MKTVIVYYSMHGNSELPDILIGVTLGIASSLACYLDLRKFIKSKEKRDSQMM